MEKLTVPAAGGSTDISFSSDFAWYGCSPSYDKSTLVSLFYEKGTASVSYAYLGAPYRYQRPAL